MKLIALLILLVSGSAFGQISTHKTYDESLRGRRVTSLSNELFGEKVNLKDGTIEFSQTDVSIPTNSGLRLEFTRQSPRWKQGADKAQLPLGSGWEIDIPYMMGTYDTRRGWDNVGGARCSGSQMGPTQWVGPSPNYNTTVMSASLYWSGIHINMPGAGGKNLLKLAAGHIVPQDGSNYIGGAEGFWRVGCLAQLKNATGEGFFVVMPDGTKYYFDWMATRNAFDALDSEYYRNAEGDGTNPTGLLVPTSDVFLYATKVEDRFGNTVTYNFDPVKKHQLTSIVSSDGGRIDLTYNQSGQVSQVVAAGRTWTYNYGTSYYGPILTEVILPDSSKWTFYGDMMWWYVKAPVLSGSFYDNACAQNAAGYRSQDNPPAGTLSTLTFTHPSGAVGTFVMRDLIHGSDNSPGGCGIFGTSSSNFTFGSYGVPSAYMAKSLVSKTLSGPGLADKTWTYTYAPSWSFSNNCAVGCTSTTTVTKPGGDLVQYVYGNSYTSDIGQIKEERTLRGGSVFSRTTFQYGGSSPAYPATYGEIVTATSGLADLYGNPNSVKIKPILRREIIQDGVVFRYNVDEFDSYARPKKVTKSSGLTP